MNATEIIEHIKALPPQERKKVQEYLRCMEAMGDPTTRKIRHASKEAVQAAGEKILTEHAELFRRLADYERKESADRS